MSLKKPRLATLLCSAHPFISFVERSLSLSLIPYFPLYICCRSLLVLTGRSLDLSSLILCKRFATIYPLFLFDDLLARSFVYLFLRLSFQFGVHFHDLGFWPWILKFDGSIWIFKNSWSGTRFTVLWFSTLFNRSVYSIRNY